MISGQGDSDTVAFSQVGLQRNAVYDKLILRKMTVATKCHISKLICPKFDFSCISTPYHVVGAYKLQRSPRPLAGFKEPTSKGREGRKDGMEGQGRGKKRIAEGK